MRLSSLIANASPVAGIIISVALMLFSGFAMTRLTKLARLPNVTGYILAGILIGPYVLNLVPQRIIDGTDFLSDIALAFIAFSTGEFFKLPVLKKSGMKVVWITVFEAVLASVFIFILTYFILRLDLAFSIVLAALASATAPASTMMTIRQTGAKGDFVDTLLQVVALDDVVGLVLYSIAISIALASLSGVSGFSFETLGNPVLLNLLVLLLGSIFGLFMKLLMPQKRSKDNKLIISVALLFAFCGVCALLDLSPLLGCMVMGTVYTNIADDDKLFKQLNYFSPLRHVVPAGRVDLSGWSLRRRTAAGDWCKLFPCAHSWQIRRRMARMPACQKRQAGAQLSGTCAHPAGRRSHWPCGAWRQNAWRRDGQRPADRYPCFKRPI